MIRPLICAPFFLIGCYSGPLTPEESSAITQSARTLNPGYVIGERSAAYGASLGAALAGDTGLPNQPVQLDSWSARSERIEALETSNEEKEERLDSEIEGIKSTSQSRDN